MTLLCIILPSIPKHAFIAREVIRCYPTLDGDGWTESAILDVYSMMFI